MARITTAKEAIVSVADQILNERGTDHVTIREILHESKQNNMSAIKYYFGDRDGLLRAVFRRRRAKLNVARKARVDTLEAEGLGADVRALIGAAIYPVVDHLRTSTRQSDYARFAARMTPRINYSSSDVETLDPADQQIIKGLRQALAHLPEDVVANRIDTAFNMLVGVLAAYEYRREESLDYGPGSLDELSETLIDMVAAGLSADLPLSPHRPPSPEHHRTEGP